MWHENWVKWRVLTCVIQFDNVFQLINTVNELDSNGKIIYHYSFVNHNSFLLILIIYNVFVQKFIIFDINRG